MRVYQEGKVGRTRATNDEWRAYYERADRARARTSYPLERHMRRLRQRNALFNVCVALLVIGLSAAITAFVFSFLGAA